MKKYTGMPQKCLLLAVQSFDLYIAFYRGVVMHYEMVDDIWALTVGKLMTCFCELIEHIYTGTVIRKMWEKDILV